MKPTFETKAPPRRKWGFWFVSAVVVVVVLLSLPEYSKYQDIAKAKATQTQSSNSAK